MTDIGWLPGSDARLASKKMKKNILIFGLALIILLGIGIAGRWLILGGASVVSLNKNPLSTPVEHTLNSSSPTGLWFIESKDYTLANVRYFQDKQWVVVLVKPIGETIDSSHIVLKKDNEMYRSVLGPGTSFSQTEFDSLPNEVSKYLTSETQ